jgi:hypothetical protein
MLYISGFPFLNDPGLTMIKMNEKTEQLTDYTRENFTVISNYKNPTSLQLLR